MAPSTESAGPIALKDYVGRMKDGQDAIYYMTGTSREAAARSPHLEAFRARGWEVLFFVDPVDELWLRMPRGAGGAEGQARARAESDASVDDEAAPASRAGRERPHARALCRGPLRPGAA